ncbi:MAG: ATP-dependent protease ATP-binding subunit HslU [Rhodospirillaceae bacterium]|nr:ATP-dependent protease ATP-binding subunit HslU [Rhodospirillaceae bacterium]
MSEFTPREIVSELDRFIVGQADAKRSVAIALRNRWRRQQLPEELREEVLPKNILMIGPTGVGKTEIARRLARLAQAPFVKIEATKFTEVGYVGRDVEQIVRDLVDTAMHMVRERMRKDVTSRAELNAEERVLDALVGESSGAETRNKFRRMLRDGELDDKEIDLEMRDSGGGLPTFEVPGMPGAQVGMLNLNDMLGKAFGQRTKPRRMTVKDSHEVLIAEESDKLLDEDKMVQEALHLVEQSGIVFLDEVDKICASAERHGADVSREGVQRDLLPELQGRLPIRVELRALDRTDFVRILTEPENSLIRQYTALLGTEGVTLDFTEDGIETIASLSAEINAGVENIGARRLHTVLERVLEEVSFTATDQPETTVSIDAAYVEAKVGDLARNADLSKFIL